MLLFIDNVVVLKWHALTIHEKMRFRIRT